MAAANLVFYKPLPVTAALLFGELPSVTGTIIKAWNGSVWLEGILKRWDGLIWTPATLLRWNGANWV